MKAIAENIKSLRITNHMTQQQLADAMSVSRNTVTRWETDTTVPDSECLARLAEFFGVSLDYLFDTDVGESNATAEQRRRESVANFKKTAAARSVDEGEVSNAIIARINNLCATHHITITDLCRAANISNSLTHFVARRTKGLKVITLAKVAAAFGISLLEFFDSPEFK